MSVFSFLFFSFLYTVIIIILAKTRQANDVLAVLEFFYRLYRDILDGLKDEIALLHPSRAGTRLSEALENMQLLTPLDLIHDGLLPILLGNFPEALQGISNGIIYHPGVHFLAYCLAGTELLRTVKTMQNRIRKEAGLNNPNRDHQAVRVMKKQREDRMKETQRHVQMMETMLRRMGFPVFFRFVIFLVLVTFPRMDTLTMQTTKSRKSLLKSNRSLMPITRTSLS